MGLRRLLAQQGKSTRLLINIMNNTSKIHIDVWSDYVCPFCYLQLPELKRLQQSAGTNLEITWRGFELRPDPHPTLDPAGEYLHTTWERSVYPMARQRGMTLRLPPVQPRSRKAMEAAEYARIQGKFDAMHEALFRAFFEEGRDIGQTPVLLAIAESAGLPIEPLRDALENSHYTQRVLEDEALGQDLGITGVPIMLLRHPDAGWSHALPLQGAVSYEQMQAAVERLSRSRA
jgi:predicted DsbA family dithiol-disulfide isomerase